MGRTVPAFAGYTQAAQEELNKTMHLALRRMITKYPKLASKQMEESVRSESEEDDAGEKLQSQEVEGAEPDEGEADNIPWWKTQAEVGPSCT